MVWLDVVFSFSHVAFYSTDKQSIKNRDPCDTKNDKHGRESNEDGKTSLAELRKTKLLEKRSQKAFYLVSPPTSLPQTNIHSLVRLWNKINFNNFYHSLLPILLLLFALVEAAKQAALHSSTQAFCQNRTNKHKWKDFHLNSQFSTNFLIFLQFSRVFKFPASWKIRQRTNEKLVNIFYFNFFHVSCLKVGNEKFLWALSFEKKNELKNANDQKKSIFEHFQVIEVEGMKWFESSE